MFEQIFDEYRKAVEQSFQMQREMYRQWMNGWPIKPPEVPDGAVAREVKDQIHSYQRKWSRTLSETMDRHRESLNAQYKSGIEAIQSAFRTTEAKTPEEYWRLTQEFWRKSIDSYKTAYEAQSKYVQSLAEMWLEMITRGKV
ncbi:MAG: hypothetical protein U0790_04790 [Isosphaeraceae bacterium]